MASKARYNLMLLVAMVVLLVVTVSTSSADMWAQSERMAPRTLSPEALFSVTLFKGTPKSVQAMEWRIVGPPVGNRGTTVAMHPTDRNVFFFGHSSGGLFKSEDAGQYWIPISDGQFNVGSIGAMAIAPSNPDIMYVGTGEPQLRDCVSWGDGVYKSVDGGKTWTNIGLK